VRGRRQAIGQSSQAAERGRGDGRSPLETREISANGKISSLRDRIFVSCLSDDPNPEGGAQVRLGIDRFHRSEEEYARSTGARFRSSSDAGELQ
jgi:hypothetical protein